MKQALMIDGTEVEYAVNTENVIAVLGRVYIYRQPTYTDLLAIIYRGLKSTLGYTLDEFITAVQKGQIYASRNRHHYRISDMRSRILTRIRQINREYINMKHR